MVDELQKGVLLYGLWAMMTKQYMVGGSNVKFILNFETYYEGAKLVFKH